VLADKTLLAAYAGQTRTLTPAHLDAAAGDADMLPLPSRALTRPGLRRWAWLTAALMAALGLLAFVAWQALSQPPSVPFQPAAARQPTAVNVAKLAAQTERWLAAAAPGTLVIQIASAKEAAEAAVLLGSLAPATPQPVRVLHGLSQGKPAWMILAGEFANRDAAMAALRTLPPSPAGAPFLRTVGKMRTVVLPTGR
jgi:septal ring-binding cell division protein DamX